MNSNKVTLEQVKLLAAKLPSSEQLKLIAHICEQLSAAATKEEVKQLLQERLRLAEELLTECDDIKDDSQGKFDAVEDIRWMRQERLRQICRNNA